jgi:predicted ABC-type ATPase
MARPVLFVLAGVNGAGKSSIGGHLLTREGLSWFNPDAFARELRAATGCDQTTANGRAWAEGVRRLNDAITLRHSYAFETTLGGRTIAATLRDAVKTHDVCLWFCGLDSADRHVARVQLRVQHGGHDIPVDTIRARYPKALRNLISLMPLVAHVQVFDNSRDAEAGSAIPDPQLVLDMARGRLIWPTADDHAALSRTPVWARPLVEAALTASPRA